MICNFFFDTFSKGPKGSKRNFSQNFFKNLTLLPSKFIESSRNDLRSFQNLNPPSPPNPCKTFLKGQDSTLRGSTSTLKQAYHQCLHYFYLFCSVLLYVSILYSNLIIYILKIFSFWLCSVQRTVFRFFGCQLYIIDGRALVLMMVVKFSFFFVVREIRAQRKPNQIYTLHSILPPYPNFGPYYQNETV